MGFNRGTKLGAENRKGHRWINNPNNAHRKCTKCGCMADVISSKGESIYTYTDTKGNKSAECPLPYCIHLSLHP